MTKCEAITDSSSVSQSIFLPCRTAIFCSTWSFIRMAFCLCTSSSSDSSALFLICRCCACNNVYSPLVMWFDINLHVFKVIEQVLTIYTDHCHAYFNSRWNPSQRGYKWIVLSIKRKNKERKSLVPLTTSVASQSWKPNSPYPRSKAVFFPQNNSEMKENHT